MRCPSSECHGLVQSFLQWLVLVNNFNLMQNPPNLIQNQSTGEQLSSAMGGHCGVLSCPRM